ncbi:alpha/beta hydrolase [Fodinicola acaciae]|uniref:alpha/beta hydrolase n=1 Tax=Fodinicola acaciae TaxID=2681555 RepID=UPI0013D84CBA|nr:alpha/beta hydrolase fold domain-containing protein [Fodinicola acaciae]
MGRHQHGGTGPAAGPAGAFGHSRRRGSGMSHYLAGHPVDDPALDPLHTDLTGMPPMLIQAAAGDEGLPDAERLAAHARACGVDVRLEIYPVAAQSFPLYWSFLPEAADALDQLARFVR